MKSNMWTDCVPSCAHLLADSVEVNNSGVCVMWLLLALPIDWLLGEAEGGVCMLISFRRWSCKTRTQTEKRPQCHQEDGQSNSHFPAGNEGKDSSAARAMADAFSATCSRTKEGAYILQSNSCVGSEQPRQAITVRVTMIKI